MSEAQKMFKKVGQLKTGGYVLIDDNACKIRSIEKSKPGKHGATKARIVAFGIFDNQKRNLLKPTDADADVPVINKSSAQVVAIVGKNIQIMDLKSYEMINVKLGDIKPKQGDEVEYLEYDGNVKLMSIKGD